MKKRNYVSRSIGSICPIGNVTGNGSNGWSIGEGYTHLHNCPLRHLRHRESYPEATVLL